MQIGIGCITYNRPKHLELWLNQYSLYKSDEMSLLVVDDTKERKGVAHRTNEILNHFKDCDHIFIFNDDCFPIKKGWEKVYIETGLNHLLYFRETVDIEKMKTESGVDYFTNCGGCLMYITKEVIEKVGYLNKDYGLYGYEHAGYSMRIHKAGLIPHPYMVPSNAGEYIYSLDYDNYLDFEIDHKPSLTVKEAEESIKKNRQIFFEDIKTIYQPYDA